MEGQENENGPLNPIDENGQSGNSTTMNDVENNEGAEMKEKLESEEKPLNITNIEEAKKETSDLIVFGNGDAWKLLGKASSKKQGWMKSTKAMQIDGLGCIVQVTTQNYDNVAEAVVFVPGVKIANDKNEAGEIIGRHLVKF